MPRAGVKGICLSREEKDKISDPMKHLFGMFPSSCYTPHWSAAPSITAPQPLDPNKQQFTAQL